MSNERTILAIGRIERALAKLETYRPLAGGDTMPDLRAKHDRLKSEAQWAITEMDRLLNRDSF